MNQEQELSDQLDQYAKGTLRGEELLELEDKMKSDPVFRKKVEEHLHFVRALKIYGNRQGVKQALDEIHQEAALDKITALPSAITSAAPFSTWRKYWPMTAVAASVALISILGTLFITQSLETKQSAYYKELRRNVEQIKKSQNLIMADIAESKVKEEPLPGKYAGTGFLISANGYVATSHHVIKGADSVYIENEIFGRLKANVLFSDPANDVSILMIEQEEFIPFRALPYTISYAEASLGEDVFTLGFPREDIVFGEGSVSASTGYGQNPNAYQVSVPVNPGNSGGPLFNGRGDLIGIISGIQTETSGAAFAIKSSVLLDAIGEIPADTLSVPLVLSRQNTLKNLNKVQQVKKWKEYVFMVRVYNN